MHFWIDKRSQACGFGRARVAASLSGSGFGYHPRRPRGKSMAPVHRFPSIQAPPTAPQRQTRGNHSHHHHHHHHSQGPQPQHESNCHLSMASLPHMYTSGPSHSLDLEHGSLGISGQSDTNTGPQLLLGNDTRATESQLLPAHLKCGMWASLALATVFVAGAKFYFDHQGTGLEVLIFCAFSATFFLAACTVSLCRRSRDIHFPPVTPSVASVDHVVVNTTAESPQIVHQQTVATLSQQSANAAAIVAVTPPPAPPPPYHIAILLPENSKDVEESPPPAYDKIVI